MTRERMVLLLQQEYSARREDNLRAYEERVREVCDRCDGLRPLLDARRAALMSGLRNALYPARKDENSNANLTGALEIYNTKIAAMLKAAGLPADALAPVYTCPLCKDEGYVYGPKRRMCSCFEGELNRRMLGELGLQSAQTFENYQDACFSGEPVLGKLSQRVLMKQNRSVCERYADGYPNTGVTDMLFTGKSGLGKTFLMQAIATGSRSGVTACST